jgi:hypothetical protein
MLIEWQSLCSSIKYQWSVDSCSIAAQCANAAAASISAYVVDAAGVCLSLLLQGTNLKMRNYHFGGA